MTQSLLTGSVLAAAALGAILRWFTQALSAGFRRALGAAQILAPCGYLSDKIGHDWSGFGQGFCPGAPKPCYARASAVGESPQPAMAFTPENQVRTGLPAGGGSHERTRLSPIPCYTGKIQGISLALASGTRIWCLKNDYNQRLTNKFPARRNRELNGPYQGIKSA